MADDLAEKVVSGRAWSEFCRALDDMGGFMNANRYQRQILVNELGQKGQELLSKKHAIIIGAGGLGSNSANLLIRMGIGRVDIIDYDIIDISNLHRTSVFSEYDIGNQRHQSYKNDYNL